MASVVLAAERVVPWALSKADKASNDTRNGILRSLKPLSYNIGSFLWIGWDEAGIELSPEAVKCGYHTAQRHWAVVYELAETFDATPVEVSRARWLLGAYELAAGNIDAARDHFAAAETSAKEVGETADAALNAAYAALTERLLPPETGGDRFERALHALRAVDDGEA